MSKRKPISDSTRWTVFYRDGFTCRYCGVQAGEEGVSLAVDHVVSVADGGDNRIDNLVTACRQCNGGKSARSLRDVPAPHDVMRRIEDRMNSIQDLGDTIRASIAALEDLEQEVVNLKCAAYRVQSTRMTRGEVSSASRLIREFGADKVLEWYMAAYRNRVSDWNAIKYVCGCARNERGGV